MELGVAIIPTILIAIRAMPAYLPHPPFTEIISLFDRVSLVEFIYFDSVEIIFCTQMGADYQDFDIKN